MSCRPAARRRELVLAEEVNGCRHAFALDAADGGFTATLTPARIETLGGPLPLPQAEWLLYAGDTPVAVAAELRDALPLTTVVDHKPFAFGVAPDDQAALVVRQDLDEDERGGYNQRRLREVTYTAGRGEPLRDAVVYTSFLGRQYSDSPRAIHEELVRRDAPLEHLWVVRDGRCRVPETARVAARGQPRVPRGDGAAPATWSRTITSRTGSSAGRTSSACRPGTARR